MTSVYIAIGFIAGCATTLGLAELGYRYQCRLARRRAERLFGSWQ
jgi:hypothetical protein